MASSSASGLVFVSGPRDYHESQRERERRWVADSVVSTGVLDREGNARKVVNCSCVVVKDWGEESQERSILLNYFQSEA